MKLLFIVFCLLVFKTGMAQNPLWVAKDRKLVTRVSQAVNDPALVQKLFDPKTKTGMNNLGFNYAMIETTKPAGYISIRCTFYYFKDSLIAYVVYPRLPSEPELYEKYLGWYKRGFITDSTSVEPFYNNIEILRQPLEQYAHPSSTNPKILFYSSPESGIIYGNKGGISPSYLQNRRLFIELENELNQESVLQLLYSKNPSSRLSAIEYCYNNPDLFEGKQIQIDQWIETVFEELPYVSTMMGCIGSNEKARELVKMFRNEEE